MKGGRLWDIGLVRDCILLLVSAIRSVLPACRPRVGFNQFGDVCVHRLQRSPPQPRRPCLQSEVDSLGRLVIGERSGALLRSVPAGRATIAHMRTNPQWLVCCGRPCLRCLCLASPRSGGLGWRLVWAGGWCGQAAGVGRRLVWAGGWCGEAAA